MSNSIKAETGLIPSEENIVLTEEDVEVNRVKDVHFLNVSMSTLNRDLRNSRVPRGRVAELREEEQLNTPRQNTPTQTPHLDGEQLLMAIRQVNKTIRGELRRQDNRSKEYLKRRSNPGSFSFETASGIVMCSEEEEGSMCKTRAGTLFTPVQAKASPVKISQTKLSPPRWRNNQVKYQQIQLSPDQGIRLIDHSLTGQKSVERASSVLVNSRKSRQPRLSSEQGRSRSMKKGGAGQEMTSSFYQDETKSVLDEFFQAKGLVTREKSTKASLFNENAARSKDSYYKDLSGHFDTQMAYITELIIQKRRLIQQKKNLKEELNGAYKTISSTYDSLHKLKREIGFQLKVNEEKQQEVHRYRTYLKNVQEEIQNTYARQEVQKEEMKERANELSSVILTEKKNREKEFQELLVMGDELENEKMVLQGRLKEAKECAKNLREKLDYQKKMESTRDRMIIEKSKLMRQLIQQESISGQAIKRSAGKDTFELARGISSMLGRRVQ